MSEATPIPSADPPIITKSAAKKEAKRLEKEAKLAAKAVKVQAAPSDKKTKEKTQKSEEEIFVNDTPKGQKKDLSKPMGSGYNPLAVEAAWYDWWEEQGFFKPQLTPDGNIKPEGLFVIPIPPPNVTGSLHIGHALTTAIQDTLIRWNRMLGKTTLFVPGFDHASISTQSVVERRLFKTSGRTRHDLGREKFLETVMEWKNDYQGRITNQLRRLGGSYDWTRTAFTMDERLSKAVVETFCRLREEGTIYRANRLVNWCVKMNTALSNLEVDTKTLEGRTMLNVPGYDPKEKFEFGVIVSFAYQIENSDEKIIVATTRTETMLGDTAIAVHPDDPRYTHLHGKFATHPFLNRRLPIVTDPIVDINFGTGAVKITPAHDPNDYEVGMRHKLDFISILNDDGTLNGNAGEKFKGMKRYHARVAVIQALKDAGLYIETKNNPMELKVCRKSDDIIEPILKPQWYVNCRPLAEEAMKRTSTAKEEKELRIIPDHSRDEWFRWLSKIQDWCISRQLWWGHRVPAYFVRIEGIEQDTAEDKYWVVGRTIEQATERAAALAGEAKFTLEQDEDVLDTWFSSGLWPFSIMGWPDNTSDLKLFYPNTLLETGWDILFFWVARMVMLGLKLTDQMPFAEVYCHPMVRDAEGKKMSKSLGNVIDPIDVVHGVSLETLHAQLLEGNLDEKEIKRAQGNQKKQFPNGIPQCGTDALRFALCAYSSGGRDINLDVLRIEGYRKFCNKLFNATKFVMLKLDADFVPLKVAKPTGNESLVEKWIFHKLNNAAKELNEHLSKRSFMSATITLHNFWLYELCDVYIEAMKPMTDEGAPAAVRQSAQQTLYTCLDHGLRLLHPFMPFVTEELWQRLPRRPDDTTPSIMVASFPVSDSDLVFADEERDFDLIFSAITATRSLAASYNLQDIQVTLLITSDEAANLFESQADTFKTLIKGCKSVKIVRRPEDVPHGTGGTIINSTIASHVLIAGVVDLEVELKKTEKKLDLARMNLKKVLEMESRSVPETLRLANEEKRKTLEAEISTLEAGREMFTKLMKE